MFRISYYPWHSRKLRVFTVQTQNGVDLWLEHLRERGVRRIEVTAI